MKRWLLAAACGVVALGLLLYPLIGELMSEKYHSDVETIYTAAIEDTDDAELTAQTARRLLELQAWVAEQSAAGLAPQLGNADPVQETLTAGAARLEQANDEGSAVYTVTLTAHYTMKWSDTFED